MGLRQHVKKAYHNMKVMKSFFEHLYAERERHFSVAVMQKERGANPSVITAAAFIPA